MCTMRICSLAGVAVLFICATALTQVNPVYKIMQERGGHRDESRLGKSGVDRFTMEMITDMGYGDSTIALLRENGVDLARLRERSKPWDEKLKATLSDCIVIGKVHSIEHPEGNTPFQTIAYVDVEEFQRNDYGIRSGLIPVMIVSGPSRTLFHEDTLSVGEHVLLFLSANSLIRYAYYNLPDYFNTLINDSTIRFRILGFSGGEYRIVSDSVFAGTKGRSLAAVKDEIKTITTLIGRTPPAVR